MQPVLIISVLSPTNKPIANQLQLTKYVIGYVIAVISHDVGFQKH